MFSEHVQPAGARARQKARTRHKLLRAARRLFDRHGFEATTLRMLAAETGLALGTVFVHFEDKHALLAATLHDGVEAALARGAGPTSKRVSPRLGARDQLVALAEPLFRHHARSPDLSRVLLKEGLFMSGDHGSRFDQQLHTFQTKVAAVYAAAARRGELAADVDGALAATAFLAFYLLALVAGLRGTAPTVAAQLAMLSALVDQQLDGFKPRRPRTSPARRTPR